MINEETALKVYHLIHPGETKDAHAFGLNIDENENIINHLEISKGRDIYQVLEKLSDDASGLIWDYIAVTTQGWAAPFNDKKQSDNIRPSEHPERTRVFLVSIVNSSREIISILHLEDQEPEVDSTGTGDLADALRNVYPKEKINYENPKQFFV
jgi:hypothetical protein